MRRAHHHLCQQARREGRDPFDLLDEIEQSLALDVTPASWPIGMGRDFLGTYDLFADNLLLFERGVHDRVTEPVRCSGLDDPKLPRLLPKARSRNFARRSRWRRGCAPPIEGSRRLGVCVERARHESDRIGKGLPEDRVV